MMVLRAAEILAVVLSFYIAVTQVVFPLWNGTKLFPFFRTKEKKLESELTDIRQQEAEARLARQVSEEKERLSRLQQDDTVH